MIDFDEVIVEAARAIPRPQDLPIAIARAAAAVALRSEGLGVTEKTQRLILQLTSMRALAQPLKTNEERIDELYDQLHHTDSTVEQTELLRELRQLQQFEANRLVAEAESRADFRPREAMTAIAEARRLATRHAAALDDEPPKHRD